VYDDAGRHGDYHPRQRIVSGRKTCSPSLQERQLAEAGPELNRHSSFLESAGMICHFVHFSLDREPREATKTLAPRDAHLSAEQRSNVTLEIAKPKNARAINIRGRREEQQIAA